VGPTATGKTSLAERLAQKLDGEIISADSMQVYKGMDIGTAKLPLGLRTVAYHCVDLVNPDKEFSAYAYQKAARAAMDDILARGKQPIVCGGTGLYVRAALENHFFEDEDESLHELRQRLETEALTLGAEAFHAKLAELDPQSAALIHPNNVRRVIRAFEWLEQGSSYVEQAQGFERSKEAYPTCYIGLIMPREELYARINRRVEQMMEQGLLEEVQGLLAKGYEQAFTARQAIGYKELKCYLDGELSLEAAVASIQQATRRYAKRQLCWFKRYQQIVWLDARLALDELTEQSRALL